jgi:O-antigen/teichoic acid export membrane protein
MYIKNIKWNLFEALTQLTGGFIYITLAANMLGAEELGKYATVMAFGSVIYLLFDVRSHDILTGYETKSIVNNNIRKKQNYIFFSYLMELLTKIPPTCLIFIVSIVYFPINYVEQSVIFNSTIVAILFFLSKFFYDSNLTILRLNNKAKTIAIFSTCEIIIRIFLIYLLNKLIGGVNYFTLVLITLTSTSVLNILLFYYTRKLQIIIDILKKNKRKIKLMSIFITKNKANYFTNLAISYSALMNKDLDVAIISMTMNSESVGIYKIAKTISQSIWKLVDSFLNSLMPEINFNIQNGMLSETKYLLINYMRKSLIVATVMAGISYLFIKLFAVYIFGKDFSDLYEVMPAFLIGIILSTPIIWGYPLSISINKMTYVLYGTLSGMFFGLMIMYFVKDNINSYNIAFSWTGSLFFSLMITAYLSYFHVFKK